MKLSIITPYYKTLEYTKKLAETLEPQLNDEVEWIIVDDGCNEKELDLMKAKVFHLPLNTGNPSIPRNVGLDNATGEYIAFIDSDDYVMPNYIEKIFDKMKEDFDYCYISWLASNGAEIIIKKDPPEWNNSVWKCVYRKSKIGNIRFNPKINYGEDKDFNSKLGVGKIVNITEPIYYYSVIRKGSLTELYKAQKIKDRVDR